MIIYENIDKALRKCNIPENYTNYRALDFLKKESTNITSVSVFLNDLNSSLINFNTSEEVELVFDHYIELIWNKLDNHNKDKKNDKNYYYLRVLLALLNLDYNDYELKEYNHWLKYFIDCYYNSN